MGEEIGTWTVEEIFGTVVILGAMEEALVVVGLTGINGLDPTTIVGVAEIDRIMVMVHGKVRAAIPTGVEIKVVAVVVVVAVLAGTVDLQAMDPTLGEILGAMDTVMVTAVTLTAGTKPDTAVVVVVVQEDP